MKKHFVYKLNTKGFLLLEQLIALIVTSLLLITLLSLIQVTKLYASNTDAVLLNEMEALSTQLQIEAKSTLSFSSLDTKNLRMNKNNGDVVIYYISDNRLMRQVNGKGGEVALYHCSDLNVTLISDSAAEIQLQTPAQTTSFYLSTFQLPMPIIELAVDENLELEIIPVSDASVQEDQFFESDASLQEGESPEPDASLQEDEFSEPDASLQEGESPEPDTSLQEDESPKPDASLQEDESPEPDEELMIDDSQ